MTRQEKAQESFKEAKISFQDGFRDLANGFRALLGINRVARIERVKSNFSQWNKEITKQPEE
ncbi:MAG: hypothetical protein F6J93_37760 [Oscillatoria sp. SIO1A7]|nr:hypothetical protein [Oscillatoria sp. SIO1A7]